MNSLKKGEGVPLLNFEGGPGVPLLNFRGVSRPTFKLWGGFRVPVSRGPGSWGPAPTFTPCLIFNLIYCFWTFVNKPFTQLTRISQKVKGVLMWIFNKLFSYEDEDIDRFSNLH